jgi:hypothetical protein
MEGDISKDGEVDGLENTVPVDEKELGRLSVSTSTTLALYTFEEYKYKRKVKYPIEFRHHNTKNA